MSYKEDCLGNISPEGGEVSNSEQPMDLGSFSRLVVQAKQGDAAAQSEICRQVQQYLCGLADQDFDQRLRAKLNPSDIAQQTMLKMVDGFEDFRGSSTREFYAWLNAILRNEIFATRRAYSRKRRDVRREESLPQSGDPEIATYPTTPEQLIGQQEEVERFRAVIARLPDNYAQVIQLRVFEELPFAEIALRMERSVEAVSKLWSRALIKLAEALDELD